MENQRTTHRTAPLPHNQRSKRETVSPVSPEDTEPKRRQRRKSMTHKMVLALPKKRRRYIVSDPEQRGMYVRVPPAGPNVYAVVARDLYKKQVWHTVGSADVMGIEEARDKARAAIARIKAGLPAVEPLRVKPDAFKSVAEDWLKRHVAKGKLRTQPEIERCLTKYVYPHWEDRDFVSIKRSDVASLLDVIEDENGPRQADLVLGIIRGIGNWFASRDDTFTSPFAARYAPPQGRCAVACPRR